MDNNQHFVFREYQSLVYAISWIIIFFIWSDCIFGYLMLACSAYCFWKYFKQRNDKITVSSKGISIFFTANKDNSEGNFDLDWEQIHKVELQEDGSSSTLVVTTISGMSYQASLGTHLEYKKGKFKKAVEACSGKPIGETINEAEKSDVLTNSENGYEVRWIDDKYGVVDPVTEQVLLPFDYDYIEDNDIEDFASQDGLICVGKDGKYGFIDTNNWKTVIPIEYVDTFSFRDGLVAVTNDKKNWHFVNRSNEVVIMGPFQSAGVFNEGLCPVKMQGLWGYIDTTGKEIIPCEYQDAYAFSEGMAAVCEENKWGYTNKSGNKVIDCKYQDADYFSEGLAGIEINGRWGYINQDGCIVVEPKYVISFPFEDGKASVQTRGLFGTKLFSKQITIDRRGNKIQ